MVQASLGWQMKILFGLKEKRFFMLNMMKR